MHRATAPVEWIAARTRAVVLCRVWRGTCVRAFNISSNVTFLSTQTLGWDRSAGRPFSPDLRQVGLPRRRAVRRSRHEAANQSRLAHHTHVRSPRAELLHKHRARVPAGSVQSSAHAAASIPAAVPGLSIGHGGVRHLLHRSADGCARDPAVHHQEVHPLRRRGVHVLQALRAAERLRQYVRHSAAHDNDVLLWQQLQYTDSERHMRYGRHLPVSLPSTSPSPPLGFLPI